MEKKNKNTKNKFNLLKYTLCFTLLAVMSLFSYAVLGAEEGVKTYNLACIILIIVDILLFLAMYFMIKYYRKLKDKIATEKNLRVIALGSILAFTQSWLIILIVICVIIFLAICEFAYLISQAKKELKELKEEAIRHSNEINEMLKNGNISFVMTEKDWFDIEKDKADREVRTGGSPLVYLTKELEKEQKSSVFDEARVGALQKLLEEYKDFE